MNLEFGICGLRASCPGPPGLKPNLEAGSCATAASTATTAGIAASVRGILVAAAPCAAQAVYSLLHVFPFFSPILR